MDVMETPTFDMDSADFDMECALGSDMDCQVEQADVSRSKRETWCTLSAYVLFVGVMGLLMREFSDQDFSAVLTVAAGVQCFGFALLLHKVQSFQTVAGLSARTLELYAAFFVFRLTSTCQKNGYIPVDRSGDWLYQAIDLASLLMVLNLLYCVHVKHRQSYDADQDMGLEVYRVAIVLMVVGCFVHGDLNHNVLYDVIWSISLMLDMVALVPQLVLMYKLPRVEALNAHFVFAIVLSRAMTFWFWFVGMPELAPKNGGANVTGWVIVGAHAFQLLVSAEFVIKYVTAAFRQSKEALKVLDSK
jgi:hypothetical protein